VVGGGGIAAGAYYIMVGRKAVNGGLQRGEAGRLGRGLGWGRGENCYSRGFGAGAEGRGWTGLGRVGGWMCWVGASGEILKIVPV